jgi:hypothetical protein
MKVTDIETMVLEIELAQPTWSAATPLALLDFEIHRDSGRSGDPSFHG